jgi:hypothetical protein
VRNARADEAFDFGWASQDGCGSQDFDENDKELPPEKMGRSSSEGSDEGLLENPRLRLKHCGEDGFIQAIWVSWMREVMFIFSIEPKI